eukprot:scaffold83024_cov37-Tisochrysis_lutea.AAC.3
MIPFTPFLCPSLARLCLRLEERARALHTASCRPRPPRPSPQAPLAVHVEHKSAISPTQVIALSAVDYLTAVNASTALISGKLAARAVEGNTLASESVTNSTKLLAIAVKAVVFPGNFLRAGHLIPEKKQFRSFVTNLFDSGLPLVRRRAALLSELRVPP